MSYFLSITGSQTRFSKSGFLLRTTGSILEQRAIELRTIHAVDLPVGEIAHRDLTDQFIADTTDQVQQATAILLLTPATKESVPTLLLALLERLPDNSFFDKPVLLFATGGLPAHVPVLERSYRMNKDPRQNPHLYRQLAEMKRQIEALETELQGDGPVKRN
jgi:FMN reductase